MTKWKKGMHVYVKLRTYGTDTSVIEIDRRLKYEIRSIGKKQAILDRILSSEERPTYRTINRRGRAYYLTDPSVLETFRNDHPGEPLRSHHKEHWSDLFVPAGDGNWDAEENYNWS